MEDTRKEIRFYGMKPSRAIQRQINRQIQKWLSRHEPSVSSPEKCGYRVCIEREGGNCLCCHLQVQVGSQRWESHDIGKNAQEALAHALQHITKLSSGSLLQSIGPAFQFNLANATA